MKKLFYPLAFLFNLLLFQSALGQHTFSIVAVDTATGEIGSAGATCLALEDGALAISDIVLGIGAIHTQSFWDPINQNNARLRMETGDSPQEIMDWLQANDVNNDPSLRQYNAVDLNGGNPRSAAFTGPDCFEEFIHIAGPNYAIAGNILISEDVVIDMETAFVNTSGSLADKLMAALQGAKRPGADARCLDDGVSSLSAFIRVADPSDTDSSYGNLSLDLNVWVTGTIFEPIDALQDLYDNTLSTQDQQQDQFTMFPNPAKGAVMVRTGSSLITNYSLTDVTGKILTSNDIPVPTNALSLKLPYPSGIYFLTIKSKFDQVSVKKLIIE